MDSKLIGLLCLKVSLISPHSTSVLSNTSKKDKLFILSFCKYPTGFLPHEYQILLLYSYVSTGEENLTKEDMYTVDVFI